MEARLRRALVGEIRENLRRLGGPEITQVPGASMVRVAWDAARGIPLDDKVFDAVAVAYTHGAELERYADFIVGRVMHGGVAWQWTPEKNAREKIEAVALERARFTYDGFAYALKLLEAREKSAAPCCACGSAMRSEPSDSRGAVS